MRKTYLTLQQLKSVQANRHYYLKNAYNAMKRSNYSDMHHFCMLAETEQLKSEMIDIYGYVPSGRK